MNAPRPAHKVWLLTSLGLLFFSTMVLGLFLFLDRNDPLANKQAGNTAQAVDPNTNWNHPSETATPVYWSDTSYWGGSLPDENTEVIIPSDTRMIINVDNAEAKNIIVRGTLAFTRDNDVNLDTGWVLVDGGALKAGSNGYRYDNNVTITLNDNDSGVDISCGSGDDVIDFGNHFIGVYSGFGSASSSDICQADSSPDSQKVGKVEMHGVDDRKEWTVLTEHAYKNATQITVEDATGWQVGDTIALASTDYDHRQAEERAITAVSGNQVTLDSPLEFWHFGKVTFDVDQRGEVANLSRNITIQSDQSLKDATSSAQTAFDGITRELKTTRGYVRFTEKTRILIDGVEFKDLGQEGQNNKFAVFFDRGDNMTHSYLKNSTVHHTLNRCINLEQTDYLLIENNVAYDAVGNCIALCTQPGQDHRNQYNELIDNLAFYTNTPLQKQRIRDFESKNATFWITHPNNYFEGNVAGGAGYANGRITKNNFEGAGGYGYWYEIENDKYLPSIPLFKDNKAHSNSNVGFWIRIDNKAYRMDAETVIDNYVGHHNRLNNFWVKIFGREELNNKFILQNSHLADSLGGFYAASGGGTQTFSIVELRNSNVVGETANSGTVQPGYDEVVGSENRTQPINKTGFVNQGTNMIRGAEIYDGMIEFNNVIFRNFQANSDRNAAAFSLPYDTSWHMHPQTSARGITYINAHPVDLPADFEESGTLSFMLKDVDGSTTGTPNTYITGKSNTLRTSACAEKLDWNAYVCPENRYAVLQTHIEDTAVYEIDGIQWDRFNNEPASQIVPSSGFKNYPIYVSNIPLNNWYELESLYYRSDDGSNVEYEEYYNINFRLKHANRNGDYAGLKLKGYGDPDFFRIDNNNATNYKEHFSFNSLKNSNQTGYYLNKTNDDLYIKVYIEDNDQDLSGLWDAHTLIQLRKTPTVYMGETLNLYSASNDRSIVHKNLPNNETRTKFCSINTQPSSGTVTIDNGDPHRAIFIPAEEGEFTFEYRPCVEGTGRFLPRETYTVRVLPPKVDPEVTPKVLIPPKVRIVWNASRNEWIQVQDNTNNFNLAQGSTLEITRQPDVGTATLNGRKLTYTPPEGGLQEEVYVQLRACNNAGVCGFGRYTFVSGRFQASINQDVDIVVSDDAPGILEGQWYTMGVKLKERPSGNVTINVVPSNPERLDFYRQRVTFTRSNWNTLQPLTIKLKDAQAASHSLLLDAVPGSLDDRTITLNVVPKPPQSIPIDPIPNPGLPVPEEVFTEDDETTENVDELLDVLDSLEIPDFPEESEAVIPDNLITGFTPDTDERVTLNTRQACLTIDNLDILPKDQVTETNTLLDLVDHVYDFTTSCAEAGEKMTVDLLIEGGRDSNEVFVKVNPDNTLTDITNQVEIEQLDIDGVAHTRVIYEIEDGSSLDEDTLANGVIIDPVGFATAAQETMDTNTSTSNDNTDTNTNLDNTEDTENTNATPGGVLPRTGGRGIVFSIVGLVILSTVGYIVFTSKSKSNENKS